MTVDNPRTPLMFAEAEFLPWKDSALHILSPTLETWSGMIRSAECVFPGGWVLPLVGAQWPLKSKESRDYWNGESLLCVPVCLALG